jgi:O-antigen/teichoic acid export membrane protein
LFKKNNLGIGQKKPFLKSVGIYTTANLLERAVPVFLMPVLTRLLSTYDYGVITTFNAIRTNINPVVSMATAGAVGRAYVDRDKTGFDFQCYLYNALIVNMALLLLVLTLILIFKDLIPGMQAIDTLWLLLVPILVWAAATSSIKVKLWVFQGKPQQYGIFRVTETLMELLLSILVVGAILQSWKGRIIGVGITQIFFCIIAGYILYRYDRLTPYLNSKHIKDILKFGLPLLPHSFGWMLIWTADKYLLNAMVGVSATGVYGIAYAIAGIIAFFSAPVDVSAEPVIYEKLSNLNDHNAKRLIIASYIYFFLLITGAVLLWLAAPLILRILVDKRFWGADEYILWLTIGYSFHGMYRLFAKYIGHAKKNHLMAYNTLIAGIVAVAANYVLIKLNGAIGAAQATCLAYATSFLLTWRTANRLYPMPWFSIFKPHNLKEILGAYKNKQTQ